MKNRIHGAVASLILGAMTATGTAAAADKTVLNTEKEKLSYAVGMDAANSFQAIAQDIDINALQRAIANAFSGAAPLQSEEVAKVTDQALRQNLEVRAGGQAKGVPPGSPPPAVSKEQVGLMLGDRAIGPALIPLKDKIDLPILIQAMRTKFTDGATPLLTEEEARATLQAFMAAAQQEAAVRGQETATRNREEGRKFLAENKARAGVITTPSGLQYQVLQEGTGQRPKSTDRVRVNYEGKLLDGQVFDSSYQRGQPAEFGLNQVIAGWTEGVALMPVGAKYRFWIPSGLAYGPSGAGNMIGPDATLVFEVELLDILK
ncbi:MAG: FKBP-type peptidyl-prolyl cis-trans isomerase [Xanthomonadaceae bacterium]|jgi:FKBP-type peptidyl-prolyl cis-trans isomerase FkpA|nr:FKBP-type peptidyl-prolyl cis-trans isomerase [Xanthomonadaceae bacterium]